jgi:hypothetical protein
MIVFDLKCGTGGHVFEAWFGTSEDFEVQKARGLVTCPICGSDDVVKAVMAPAVGAKSNQGGGNQQPQGKESVQMAHGSPASSGGDSPEAMKALLSKLAEAQAKALENSDYVGTGFADEARAMHDGEIDERPIHGETTLDEAKTLIEDGVPVSPLPLPVRPPKSDN